MFFEKGIEAAAPVDSPLPADLSPAPIKHSSPIPPARRSHRQVQPPIWLKDYHTPAHSTAHLISACVSYANISSTYQNYLTVFSVLVEPTMYKQTACDPHWQQAMSEELASLTSNHTWDIVPLPTEKVLIGCKCVYRLKYLADGTLDRYKALLVAKGYTQQEGIDYQETFLVVVKMVTVWSIVALAAQHNWRIHQMNVSNAF